MKRLALAGVALIAFVGLTACETVKGAGRDIGNAGEAVTESAEEVQS